MSTEQPISAYQLTLGMLYFARMLDKIRKRAEGRLAADFHANLGKGFDGQCAGFLRVPYEALVRRTLEGGSDEEILQWCYQFGRPLDELDVRIWNGYLSRCGWNDSMSDLLAQRKRECGWQDVEEIQTMLEFFEYDEGRKRPAQA